MFETIQSDPPLASARDLAAYYARRERFYTSASLLLARPPDRAVVTASSRALERGAVRDSELARTLDADRQVAAAEHERLFGGPSPRIDPHCRDPGASARVAALEYVVLPASVDIASELRTLAILSDRTASAIESGDIADAAALCDVQARFLRQHAGACVRALATHLVACDLPFYAALGRALITQVDEDLRLLAH
jgi:hypothetical protein